jgi:transposase-like protein
LYRAVDKAGRTINFFLSVRWDHHAAQRFLAKGIRRHGVPERTTIDRSGANTEPEMNWKGYKPHCRAIGMSQWEASQAVQRAEEFARAVKARLSRQGGPL